MQLLKQMKKAEVRDDKKHGYELSGWLSQRVLMPHAIGLESVDRPKYVMHGWGPKALLRPFARWIFALEEKFLLLHEVAGWAGVLECG